ncbi:MAG: Crp/Fnr family transcriptional regulator [Clostridia bacterium]|nr:Crp/Fnr family transcriptional regulator [Clostridia bacterium]
MKDFLRGTFLFKETSDELVFNVLNCSPPIQREFKRGDLIYPFPTNEKMVGFVYSGRCEIRRARSDGGRVVLNILNKGDSFGILSIYSKEDFPTQIFASKNSTILFFTEEQIYDFVNNYSQISTNLIVFLANRIEFLNKKIETFSGCRVENRLSAFLLCEYEKNKSNEFTFNCRKTSEEINAGRASVYRALSSLQSDGLINLIDKKIIILDPQGLERIVK